LGCKHRSPQTTPISEFRAPTELIGNDENGIQGHFNDATVSKTVANKIDKLLMVSDFNEN
jgi:hypothetical protein